MHTYTKECVVWWAQSRSRSNPQWVENYQKSLHVRHRTAIVEQMKALTPTSVLEIGCHCGPNLIRIAQVFPDVQCRGLDVNVGAVDAGNAWAHQLKLDDRIALESGAFPECTDALPTGCFDVVLSCYSLAYIESADLAPTLYEVGRLAKRAIVLAEPMVNGRSTSAEMSNGYREWAHDYEAAKAWIGSWAGMTTRLVPVAPPVDRLNAILVGVRE